MRRSCGNIGVAESCPVIVADNTDDLTISTATTDTKNKMVSEQI